jgi:hypothetical protein
LARCKLKSNFHLSPLSWQTIRNQYN